MTTTSTQIAANQKIVTALYISMFDRAPERAGLDYWSGRLNAGERTQAIAESMFSVSSVRVLYPTGMSHEAIITKLYQNTLGREPDAGGLAYWKAELDGGKSVGSVFLEIATAVMNYSGTAVAGIGSTALLNAKIELSLNYAALMGGNDVTASANVYTQLKSTTATSNGTIASDTIVLATGDYAVNGGGGNDTITVGAGNSVVTTGDGDDTITTSAGNSFVNAGNGDNTVTTGAGVNAVVSGSGKDVITTNAGPDTIKSGAGPDNITSGAGEDIIVGGPGADLITAGIGRDAIVLSAAGDSAIGAADSVNAFGVLGLPVSAPEMQMMRDAASFQAVATAKGGVDADLLRFSSAATLGGVQETLGANIDASYTGKSLTIKESASGILTIIGSDAALVDTLAKWTFVADAMAAATGNVVAFELAGSTYVFQQGGATDDMVQLSGLAGVTGIALIGQATAGIAGNIAVM